MAAGTRQPWAMLRNPSGVAGAGTRPAKDFGELTNGWPTNNRRARLLFAIALASHFKRDLVTRQGNIIERSLIAIAPNDYAAQFVALLFELERGFNGLAILRGEGRFPCAGEIMVRGE